MLEAGMSTCNMKVGCMTTRIYMGIWNIKKQEREAETKKETAEDNY